MNQSRGGGFVAILLAFAAFVVALLAWLAPFSPVGPSPFAPDDNEPTVSDLLIEPASVNVPVPTAEQSSAPTTESVTITLPQAGDIRTVMRGGVVVEQVFVPAGSFMMGTADGQLVQINEQPIHEVKLNEFWIDRTEVTNTQFDAFVENTSYKTTAERFGGGISYLFDEIIGFRGVYTEDAYWKQPIGLGSDIKGLEKYPVVQVSWDDALAFCEWAGGRLPTEAEWEYAARGHEGLIYPWGVEIPSCDIANYSFDCVQGTAEVGTYLKGSSWVGALEMSGNVWEWVSDWYDSNYYSYSPHENPQGPSLGESKLLRGGGWTNYAYVDDQRSAYRYYLSQDERSGNIGFRCAQD